jgi:uncharacterized DUF497 family protein
MVFVWDELKNRMNQRKHDIAFETAAIAFHDPGAISYPDLSWMGRNVGTWWELSAV